MAVHDNREFEQLFAAYSNGELTKAERSRLHVLAGQDVGRRGALAEMQAVRELFDVEVGMRRSNQRPVEPAEEADESYRRLASAGARAESDLRASLEQATMIQTLPSGGGIDQRSAVQTWGMVLAAVALVVVSVLIGIGVGRGPNLDGSNPDQEVLGAAVLHARSVLTADSNKLSWDAVRDAIRYDAVILDADKVEVLRPPPADLRTRRATDWTLGAIDLAILRKHDKLFLRVLALDKHGEVLARTSHEQQIKFR